MVRFGSFGSFGSVRPHRSLRYGQFFATIFRLQKMRLHRTRARCRTLQRCGCRCVGWNSIKRCCTRSCTIHVECACGESLEHSRVLESSEGGMKDGTSSAQVWKVCCEMVKRERERDRFWIGYICVCAWSCVCFSWHCRNQPLAVQAYTKTYELTGRYFQRV